MASKINLYELEEEIDRAPKPGSRKVVRVIVIEGDPGWVDRTLERSYIQPDQPRLGGRLREIYRSDS